jgi:hypothetical protein
MKKKKNKKELDKISCGSAETFPTQLGRENYFQCPIWFADAPQFVADLNKASDPYIETAKKNLKKDIAKRNKKFGDRGDMGHVFHSTPLVGDPNFLQLQNYIGATANNLLTEMGFDMTNHQVFIQKCGYKNSLKMVEDITLCTLTGMVIYLVFIF